MRKRLLGRDGPLGVFVEYPLLLRLACISVCAEIAWATLLIVLQYHFKDDLLKDQAKQLIAARVAIAALAFTACETVFKVPMGHLSDRLGPRPMILFALGLAALSPLLMMVATQWYHFVPLRIMDGVAAAALWPSMSALMSRSVPRQAKAAAMSVFNGAYCLGLAIGPMMGLYLGHRFGNRSVFPLCSFILMGGLLLAWSVLRGGIGDRPSEIPADKAEHIGQDFPSRQGPLLKGRPLLLRMMILYALSQTAVGMLYVMPIYLEKQFAIREGDLPRMIAVPALLVAFIALPLGRLADSIGRAKAVWISYVFATAGMLMVALTSLKPVYGLGQTVALLIFGAGMLLLVASYILGTPAWLGLTSVQVEDKQQGQALSLMQTAQGVGVNIGLGLVASAATLMTQWKTEWRRVDVALARHKLHLPHFPHLPKLPHFPHFPGHPGAAPEPVTTVVVPATKLVDTVPITVWLWAATAVFALCMIGTLLFVREPEHALHSGEAPPAGQQPFEVSGV